MKDLEYQDRFVNCFMNHYRQLYEIHVFTNLDQLKKTKPHEYVVILTEEYSTEDMAGFVERGEILLNLEGYQEVYKIVEKIAHLVVSNDHGKDISKGVVSYQKTGIYSLTREQYQMPFAVLLAKIYSEEKKTLIIDLQGYSGFQNLEVAIGLSGLEDLLSVAMTGKYSKGRLLESIHQEDGFDFVAPVQNNQCLLEGSDDLFTEILNVLASELGYERFVINFGALFPGQVEMMQSCEELFLLSGSEKEGNWREESFYRQLNNLEKESLVKDIKKIIIPHTTKAEYEWRSLVDRWRFGAIGEMVRDMVKKEFLNGTVM